MVKRTADKAWYLVPAILQADPKLINLPIQAAKRAVLLAEALDREINAACDTSDSNITKMADTIDKQEKEIASLKNQLAQLRSRQNAK